MERREITFSGLIRAYSVVEVVQLFQGKEKKKQLE